MPKKRKLLVPISNLYKFPENSITIAGILIEWVLWQKSFKPKFLEAYFLKIIQQCFKIFHWIFYQLYFKIGLNRWQILVKQFSIAAFSTKMSDFSSFFPKINWKGVNFPVSTKCSKGLKAQIKLERSRIWTFGSIFYNVQNFLWNLYLCTKSKTGKTLCIYQRIYLLSGVLRHSYTRQILRPRLER